MKERPLVIPPPRRRDRVLEPRHLLGHGASVAPMLMLMVVLLVCLGSPAVAGRSTDPAQSRGWNTDPASAGRVLSAHAAVVLSAGDDATRALTPGAELSAEQTIATAEVSGLAWRDDNSNRQRDQGEPPMSGITVMLTDPAYAELATQVTIADGSYKFSNLAAGSYCLTKEDPFGYVSTYPPSGVWGPFPLEDGKQLTGLDFGFALSPTGTPTATPTWTPTPTATSSATPTGTLTSVATETPTYTPTLAPTLTPTLTPTPMSTPAGNLQDPIPIACREAYSGSTAGHPSVINDYGACGAGMWGPEIVYSFHASYALDWLSITLDTPADLALFVLSSANPATCFSSGGSVVLPSIAQGVNYYIVVDGSDTASYTMQVYCHPPPGTTPTFTPTPTATATVGSSPTPTGGPSPTPTEGPSPTPTKTRTPGWLWQIYLPIVYKPGIEFRVDCGADTDYTDIMGHIWLADKEYAPGSWGYVGDSGGFANYRTFDPPNPDERLYQTQRWAEGSFGYRFDVPNGTYDVELHFAELYRRQAGQRKFNVDIEGQRVLEEFDVCAQAGGAFIAVVRTFTVTVSDQQLYVDFTPGSIENPMIGALRVTRK
jgi:hypothetical protein